MKSYLIYAAEFLLLFAVAGFFKPTPGGVHVQPPYNVQIQHALARLAKCSPATYQLITRYVADVEFAESAAMPRHASGKVSLFKPATVLLSTGLFTQSPYPEERVMWMLAHEARHLYQIHELGWWMELPRHGYDDWRRAMEEDAVVFQTIVILDCNLAAGQ